MKSLLLISVLIGLCSVSPVFGQTDGCCPTMTGSISVINTGTPDAPCYRLHVTWTIDNKCDCPVLDQHLDFYPQDGQYWDSWPLSVFWVWNTVPPDMSASFQDLDHPWWMDGPDPQYVFVDNYSHIKFMKVELNPLDPFGNPHDNQDMVVPPHTTKTFEGKTTCITADQIQPLIGRLVLTAIKMESDYNNDCFPDHGAGIRYCQVDLPWYTISQSSESSKLLLRNNLGEAEPFPNPTRSLTTIKYIAPQNGTYEWEVVDAAGRRLDAGEVARVTAGQGLTIPNALSTAREGVYFCRIRSGMLCTVVRLLKLP